MKSGDDPAASSEMKMASRERRIRNNLEKLFLQCPKATAQQIVASLRSSSCRRTWSEFGSITGAG